MTTKKPAKPEPKAADFLKAPIIDTPQKLAAAVATGKLPWHCDICGADLSADVCPIDGKVKP